MLIYMEKSNLVNQYFLTILQRNSKLVILGNLGNTWPQIPKMTLLMWRKLYHLSAGRSISSITLCLRCCKDSVSLLLWVLRTYLARHTQSDTTNLYKTFVFICRQKINFVPHAFLEILRICKLLILGTWGMPGYTHWKRYYQLVEGFDVYLQDKNKLHNSLLSWDMTL